MFASIMVVGTLSDFALLPSVCDLKSAKINVQRRLIREFTIHVFELCLNAVKAAKNICCAKGECAIVYSKVTR